jgi:hypothetical protein
MGIFKPNQDGTFEIHYGGKESPFTGGGLDSSAPPPYIAPNAFNTIQNALLADNQLVPGCPEFNISDQTYVLASDIAATIVGLGDLAGIGFIVSYDENTSTLYAHSFGTNPAASPILMGSFVLPIGVALGSLTYKNINGVCYFSASGLYYIFQHNNSVASILTTYLGCSFLGELNGRLLALNVAQLAYTTGADVILIAGDETVTGTQVNTGVTTANSTAITYGTSVPIPNNQIMITLGCNFGYNINLGTGSGQVTVNVQYSLDSGATWTTFQTYQNTMSAYASSVDNIANPVSFNVANLNTIQVRIQVVVVGYVNDTYTATADVTAVNITIPNIANPVVQYFPFQEAWSAAAGAYSIFNPLTVQNLVTGAGYNNLPDVEDTITGFFTVGPTGYIIRQSGITEQTALNSGIQPFDFNILWASHLGIGTAFPASVQQYGSVGYLASDTDIFTVGYDGISTIAGKAKSAIYSFINNSDYTMVSGIGVINTQNEPYLGYVLAFYNSNQIFYFVYRADTREWMFGTFTADITNFSEFTLNIGLFSLPNISFLILTSNIIFAVSYFNNNLARIETLLATFGNLMNVPVTEPTLLSFAQEEIGFMKFPTIDSIGLYIYNPNQNPIPLSNSSNLQLNINVSGTIFNVFLIEQSQDVPEPATALVPGWQYYVVNPQNLPYTGVSPQLNITIQQTEAEYPPLPITIGKVVLFGSVDGMQRPT